MRSSELRSPSPVLVVSIFLLAVWLVYTGLSAQAYWPSVIGALVLTVVALSFIEPDDACSTFATSGCDRPDHPTWNVDQPGWKDTVPAIAAILFVSVAGACVVTAIRLRQGRSITEKTAQLISARLPGEVPTEQGRGVHKSLIWSGAFVALAVAYPLMLHRLLFEGHAEGLRDDVIRWVGALGDNRAIITLVGLPAVFIGLEYARLQLNELRSRRAHNRALKVLLAARRQVTPAAEQSSA